ncbi:MAG TPA: hypothetical protein PLP42_15330 [Acidobacteriota bacterium]|nr:hypothetical protein [Acidobacteriota bacterium]
MNTEFSVFWGLVVPGSIVGFSLVVTLWLYRMFAKQHEGEKRE